MDSDSPFASRIAGRPTIDAGIRFFLDNAMCTFKSGFTTRLGAGSDDAPGSSSHRRSADGHGHSA